ncbi:hypothetical protein V2J09_007520 [Rumex salicifolius]
MKCAFVFISVLKSSREGRDNTLCWQTNRVSRRDLGLSDDDPTGCVEQEETSSVVDDIKWTDEKHSLYLKSMEASFVDQLYNLKDLFSPAGSSQFKVQQHCHWAKKLRKIAPQPEVVNASRKFPVISLRKDNQVSFNLNEECSGQNFNDEDCEKRAPRRQREKRLRTQDTSDEVNDQVVPFGISCLPMQDRNEGCSSMQDRTIEQCGQAAKTESAF